jgi:hypothetical protein
VNLRHPYFTLGTAVAVIAAKREVQGRQPPRSKTLLPLGALSIGLECWGEVGDSPVSISCAPSEQGIAFHSPKAIKRDGM